MDRTNDQPIRVAIAQTGGETTDLDATLSKLAETFTSLARPDIDLVVFPELSTTPYFCGTVDDDFFAWSQPIPGPVTDAFSAIARETGTAVIFGMYEKTPEGMFNSAVVIDKSGQIVSGTSLTGASRHSYRKSSIPKSRLAATSIDEKHYFGAGDGPVVFDLLGTRVACLICYDRSFPEYWLSARMLGAEVVVVLVSSLGEREALFIEELRVRAMETQVWVVAANRAGLETLNGTTTDYFGLSCIASPFGDVVAQAPGHKSGEVVEASIDLTRVQAARDFFPVDRDRIPGPFRFLNETISATRVKAGE